MEENNKDYNIPETPYNEGQGLGSNPIADIITATSNVKPERFWMVALIILCLGIAGVASWLVTSLERDKASFREQVEKKEEKISKLEKELRECPKKTLEELKLTHETLIEIQRDVKASKEEIKADNDLRENNLKMLKQIKKDL